MSEGKSPAFQFYPADFLADANVAGMTCAQVGAYIRLLCHCWLEGSLPDDDRVLAKLSGAGAKWKAMRAVVMRPFNETQIEPLSGQNRVRPKVVFRHKRLDEERRKQLELRQLRKTAAERRWCKCNANAMQVQCSSSSPSLKEGRIHPHKELPSKAQSAYHRGAALEKRGGEGGKTGGQGDHEGRGDRERGTEGPSGSTAAEHAARAHRRIAALLRADSGGRERIMGWLVQVYRWCQQQQRSYGAELDWLQRQAVDIADAMTAGKVHRPVAVWRARIGRRYGL